MTSSTIPRFRLRAAVRAIGTAHLLAWEALCLAGCGAGGRASAERSDADLPGALVPVRVPSGGDDLLGILFLADGPGPHATILLLHGFPGYENNFDLAHAVRRSGRNVLVIHYRGSWGSPGRFSFAAALADTRAAVEWLRDRAAKTEPRIDPRRIVIAGHSMGGFTALMTAATDPAIIGAASFAGFDFGAEARAIRADPGSRAPLEAAFEDALAPLAGAGAAELVDEFLERGEAWSLTRQAPRLADRPVLLVAGARDEVAPIARHHEPLVRALEGAGALRLEVMVLDADHGFTTARLELARVFLNWLSTIPGAYPHTAVRAR